MNYGSEPADQVVRYSLEGAEFALRISGTAAKNFFIFAQAVLHDSKKTHGKTHLIRLLKEQKPLKFFTVDKDRMHDFARDAKAHGFLCASEAYLIAYLQRHWWLCSPVLFQNRLIRFYPGLPHSPQLLPVISVSFLLCFVHSPLCGQGGAQGSRMCKPFFIVTPLPVFFYFPPDLLG